MINRLFNPRITLDFLIGHAFCDYPLLSNAPATTPSPPPHNASATARFNGALAVKPEGLGLSVVALAELYESVYYSRAQEKDEQVSLIFYRVNG